MNDERDKLRQVIRAQRAKLSDRLQTNAARRISESLSTHPDYLASLHIAFYFAQNGELSPQILFDSALLHGKICYLPILKNSHLTFGQYKNGDKLTPNRFGIPEPSVDQEYGPEQLDLVCVPLVGFDQCGNRLGMGGGFYDRTFAFKLKHPESKPTLIGLAHSLQRVEKIDAENWDVPLDYVATEKGIINCHQNVIARNLEANAGKNL